MNEKSNAWQLIQRRSNQAALALEKQDLDTYLSIYSPDYSETDRKGKSHQLDELRNNLKHPDFVRYVRYVKVIKKLKDVEDHNGFFLVRTESEIWLSWKSEALHKHFRWLSRIVLITKTKDLEKWVQANDEWKIISSKPLKSFTWPTVAWMYRQP